MMNFLFYIPAIRKEAPLLRTWFQKYPTISYPTRLAFPVVKPSKVSPAHLCKLFKSTTKASSFSLCSSFFALCHGNEKRFFFWISVLPLEAITIIIELITAHWHFDFIAWQKTTQLGTTHPVSFECESGVRNFWPAGVTFSALPSYFLFRFVSQWICRVLTPFRPP